MEINADAVDAVDGCVMKFTVVDGGIVLVPLLGLVDGGGGNKDNAFDPAPVGFIGGFINRGGI
jgi:hypothetical protein